MISLKSEKLEKALLARDVGSTGSPGLIAKTLLTRYFYLINTQMRDLPFSSDEFHCIYDAVNGWATQIEEPLHLHQMLWLHMDDAIRDDSLDEKWNINGKALIEKLRALNPLETFAVVEMAEMYWSNCH